MKTNFFPISIATIKLTKSPVSWGGERKTQSLKLQDSYPESFIQYIKKSFKIQPLHFPILKP